MKMFDTTRSQYRLSHSGPASSSASASTRSAAAARRSELRVGTVAVAEEAPRTREEHRDEDEKAHRIAIARIPQTRDEVLRHAEKDSGKDGAVHAAEAPKGDDDERLEREAV